MSNQPPAEITPLPEVPKYTGLTNAKAFEIGGALARLEEIKKSGPGIVTPGQLTHEDEAKALVEFLANALIEHAGELLGCFFVVKSEYNPLLQGLKPVVNRVFLTLQQEAIAAKAKGNGNVQN